MVDLHRIWDNELDILKQIDSYCENNGLKYSIAYGTLLGAIRNGGFIPWDDDIDIIMPREDYNYLIKHWDVPGYVLQNKNTNADFNQNFTKIRKDHTTFIQFEVEKQRSYHKGIFVDVFPGDRVAPNGIQRYIQYGCCAFNLLYSRDGNASKKQTVVERMLLLLPKECRNYIRKWTDLKIQSWKEYDTEFFFPSTIKDAHVYYPKDLFEELISVEFEGRPFKCIKNYDMFLHICYGEYMKLPAEGERVYTHHPVLVDFQHNYEEL